MKMTMKQAQAKCRRWKAKGDKRSLAWPVKGFAVCAVIFMWGIIEQCPACRAKSEAWWNYCAMCGHHIAAGIFSPGETAT